jgi:hypothetical protein
VWIATQRGQDFAQTPSGEVGVVVAGVVVLGLVASALVTIA